MAKLLFLSMMGVVWLLSYSYANVLPASTHNPVQPLIHPGAEKGEHIIPLGKITIDSEEISTDAHPTDDVIDDSIDDEILEEDDEDADIIDDEIVEEDGDADIIDDSIDDEIIEESDDEDDTIEDEDDIDAESDDIVEESEIIPIEEMSEEELEQYLDLEEKTFLAEADEHAALKAIQDGHRGVHSPGLRMRKKRFAPIIGRAAWAIGRALFRRFTFLKITRNGLKLTRHYLGKGNYFSALRIFSRLGVKNVKRITGKYKGYTGTMGPYRVTIRNGSSGGYPTLEIRSHGGKLIRKFRFLK